MPDIIIRLHVPEVAPRPNRHWTDEECMSRFLGDLHEMDREETRTRALCGGLVVAGLVAGLLFI